MTSSNHTRYLNSMHHQSQADEVRPTAEFRHAADLLVHCKGLISRQLAQSAVRREKDLHDALAIHGGSMSEEKVLRLNNPKQAEQHANTIRSYLYESDGKIAYTGKWNRELTAAVKRFQSQHGLVVDGIVGKHTFSALLKRDENKLNETAKLWSDDQLRFRSDPKIKGHYQSGNIKPYEKKDGFFSSLANQASNLANKIIDNPAAQLLPAVQLANLVCLGMANPMLAASHSVPFRLVRMSGAETHVAAKAFDAVARRLGNEGYVVKRDAKGIVITTSSSAYFECDSSVLTHNGLTSAVKIGSVAEDLNEATGGKHKPMFIVSGYASDDGSTEHNLNLSSHRAHAIAKQLETSRFGKVAIKTRAFGESNPAAPNSSEENRQKNRRVVIRVTFEGYNEALHNPKEKAMEPAVGGVLQVYAKLPPSSLTK